MANDSVRIFLDVMDCQRAKQVRCAEANEAPGGSEQVAAAARYTIAAIDEMMSEIGRRAGGR